MWQNMLWYDYYLFSQIAQFYGYISIFLHIYIYDIYVFLIICTIVFTSYFSNYLLSNYLLYLYQAFWHILYRKSCHRYFNIFYLYWVLRICSGREPPNIQYIKTLYGLQSTHLFHLKKYLSDMNFLGENIFTCKVNKEPHSLAFKLWYNLNLFRALEMA